MSQDPTLPEVPAARKSSAPGSAVDQAVEAAAAAAAQAGSGGRAPPAGCGSDTAPVDVKAKGISSYFCLLLCTGC